MYTYKKLITYLGLLNELFHKSAWEQTHTFHSQLHTTNPTPWQLNKRKRSSWLRISLQPSSWTKLCALSGCKLYASVAPFCLFICTVLINLTSLLDNSRLVAFVALAGLFVAANIFSKKFVFYPDEDIGSGRSLLSTLKEAVTSFLPEDEETGRFLSSLRGAAGEEGRNLGGTGSFVLFGQEHPYVNMKETTIYVSLLFTWMIASVVHISAHPVFYWWTKKTFGLPHTCSFIDYNPAKVSFEKEDISIVELTISKSLISWNRIFSY